MKLFKNAPEIRVGIGFVLLISIAFFTDNDNMLAIALASALIHEVAHIFAVYICGGYVENITLAAYGAYIKLGEYPIISYKKELLIALAGPVASAVAAYFFSLVGGALENDTLFIFSGINMMLCLLNLVPAYPLDGGRILKCLLMMLVDSTIAERICIITAAVCALGVLFFCVFFNIRMGFHLSMTIFCAFVALSFIKSILGNQ